MNPCKITEQIIICTFLKLIFKCNNTKLTIFKIILRTKMTNLMWENYWLSRLQSYSGRRQIKCSILKSHSASIEDNHLRMHHLIVEDLSEVDLICAQFVTHYGRVTAHEQVIRGTSLNVTEGLDIATDICVSIECELHVLCFVGLQFPI